jgi:hypothetical protein
MDSGGEERKEKKVGIKKPNLCNPPLLLVEWKGKEGKRPTSKWFRGICNGSNLLV